MLGTINIYRNEANMFGGDKVKATSFADFTLPLQLLMAKISMNHIQLLRAKPVHEFATDDELDYDSNSNQPKDTDNDRA